MNDEINFKNNPLHGVSLKTLLTEMVEYYGFNIIYAYLNINCFKTNPSIESSVKFLKKTDWAREKVEAFYLYQFKSLPRASEDQFQFPPRDRIVPQGQIPGEPAVLSLEDAERLREKRAKRTADHDTKKPRPRSTRDSGKYNDRTSSHSNGPRSSPHNSNSIPKTPNSPPLDPADPWAQWRDKE
ncbi:MAG: VF530 family DNA-binding protein [Marinagarivorans sp.]|nr:VF530 family DNA-binding protein [Marinagarivorans sp.]